MTSHKEYQPESQLNPSRQRVLLACPKTARHHLSGIDQALRKRGDSVSSETLQHTAHVSILDHQLTAHDILIHTDSHSEHAHDLVQRARTHGRTSGLVMDGVLEFANTFLNPSVGDAFLRPAPADIVFTLGAHDQLILQSLGNQAVPTGLPRIDAFRDQYSKVAPDTSYGSLLVATANQPWFDKDARDRVLDTLREIQQAASQRNLPVRWRVGPEIANCLRVEPDSQPLAISLAQSSAVMCTASTLAFEAMLANRPTALIHPHPWALWIPSALIYRGGPPTARPVRRSPLMRRADDAAAGSIRRALQQHQTLDTHDIYETIDALFSQPNGLLETQHNILVHCVSERAADAIATWVSKRPSVPYMNTPPSLRSRTRASNPDKLLHELRNLSESGAERIALLTNATPTTELMSLCEEHADLISGFVLPESSGEDVFLACPACNPAQLPDRLSPDALLVTSADDIASVLFGVLRAYPVDAERVRCPEDTELPAIVEQAIELVHDAEDRGEVRTTLPSRVCDSLTSVATEDALSGRRPAMLLLAGEEIDFALYAQSRAWREQGTIVCSLRWHEDELSSPERVSDIIQTRPQESFGLYGGGLHTKRLLRYAALDQAPALIIDDHAQPGQYLEDIPVVLPTEPAITRLGFIVLSSRAYETQLWTKSERFRRVGIETFPLYSAAVLAHDRLC